MNFLSGLKNISEGLETVGRQQVKGPAGVCLDEMIAGATCLPHLSPATPARLHWSSGALQHLETGAEQSVSQCGDCPSPQAGVGANTQTQSNTNTKLTEGSLSLNANHQSFSMLWLLFKLSHFIVISTT